MGKVITAGVMSMVAAVAVVGAAPVQAANKPQVKQARNDCRTYSGVKVCGKLELNEKQKRCVQKEVRQGISQRRAEVECYTYVR